MLVTIDQPSAELNVDGSTMSANCVISEGLVTMCTKKGTLAMRLVPALGAGAGEVEVAPRGA